jgi:hypothetical protein
MKHGAAAPAVFAGPADNATMSCHTIPAGDVPSRLASLAPPAATAALVLLACALGGAEAACDTIPAECSCSGSRFTGCWGFPGPVL